MNVKTALLRAQESYRRGIALWQVLKSLDSKCLMWDVCTRPKKQFTLTYSQTWHVDF